MDGGMPVNFQTMNEPMMGADVNMAQIPVQPNAPVQVDTPVQINTPVQMETPVQINTPTQMQTSPVSQTVDISSFGSKYIVQEMTPRVENDEMLRQATTEEEYARYKFSFGDEAVSAYNFDEIKKKAQDGTTTIEDLNYLIDKAGFDKYSAAQLRAGFSNYGRLVTGHSEDAQRISGVTMDDLNALLEQSGFDPVNAARIRHKFIMDGKVVSSYDVNAKRIFGITMEDMDTILNASGYSPEVIAQIRQAAIDEGSVLESYSDSGMKVS